MSDDFFSDDDDFEFSEEEEREFKRQQEEKRNLPVYKKALSLVETTKAIIDLVDPEHPMAGITEVMLDCAWIIPAKISNAEAADLYSLRFDQATIIKLNARELLAHTNMLYELKVDETYVKLLRNEIEEFRIEFLSWVKSFDKQNDIKDEWDFKDL